VDTLHAVGKLLVMHPDGKNMGLMELIPQCRVDLAEAVTPYLMTKVTLDEYYDRWCRPDRLTLWGGIPESLLLEKSASFDDLKAYLDNVFKVIHPGKRFIADVGDTSPPAADFLRLVYIGERFEIEGRLPMKAGDLRPLSGEQLAVAAAWVGGAATTKKPDPVPTGPFEVLKNDVFAGNHKKIVDDVQQMIEQGLEPKELINV
jgi:hypothetical protein